MISLKDKVALVTGGSRGIGKAVALKLASLGADIAIVDINTSEQVVEEIEKLGRKAISLKADVSKMEETNEVVSEVLKEFGKVDILVNNAGITRDNLLMKMSEEDWDSVMNINLKGSFNMTKSLIRPMLKQKICSIINMASVVGVAGNAGQCNYSASKAGLIGFTKSLAKEVAKKNIRVNAVAPGFIKSDMTDKLDDKIIEGYLANIPLGRLGDIEDIADTVAFLASDMSKYITGQVLVVDGGLFI
ncbi:3-oxoacyl-[acyl-carrier-protein] reductase FabG [Gottschalkia acidurici 9a]|uniref:3-oxoacyl-[acyl-carrier-protein] reductase n=1 Tax=Gottschalkia acidurici (strain ATCC 7906 / DSM 604 / BCRC 14475 / CIP 104303 / KCTC 5404 / NCIMB 10678 / 9a) TaxID=1128398 RepID=K0B122_GOTA9|nr:3-oxoacyl-[acyl-carrier-protein] reductase [Gottschalkia acidurici]AFS78640.1 3-oxoacyl-[acyl-carrier-protein] reductase FabG [Gottschalkia acidurici 9a]